MTRIRRLTLVALMLGFGAFAYAPPAMAGKGGGGGFLPAGTYHFTTMRADFNMFSKDPSQPNISIFVSRDNSVSRPEGGPSTTTSQTQMFLSVFSSTVNGNGCVLLTTPSDFSVAPDLKTATLKTTIDSTTPTCGPPIFLPLPLTVNVTWTGVGPLTSGSDENRFSCLTYKEDSDAADRNNLATAIASVVPALSGSFSATSAALGSHDQRVEAHGVANVNCGGGIGGKGAGPGLLSAGKYEFTRTEADYTLFPSDPSQPQIGITASRNTSASNPLGGPASSTAETDVFIFVNSATVAGVGCFVIPASDFSISSDLSTAALHTNLSGQTPTCNGFPSTISPLPLKVDVTWTGAGPISRTRDENRSECLDYTIRASTLQTINNGGSATATVSGIPGSFTSVSGMGSNDTRIHTKGVPQPACFVRG